MPPKRAAANISKKRKSDEEPAAPAPAKRTRVERTTTTTTKKGKADEELADTMKKTKISKEPAATKQKRKTDEEPAAPIKKAKAKAITTATKACDIINEAPTQRLNVYVFGEGTAGELGLGTAKGTTDVKRPRLNPNLNADKVGVVQIEAGGMHVVALTHDNKVLTWGVNDQGALGRDTTWDGGLKDMDAAGEDSDSDTSDADNGLNPHESIPGEVDFF